MGEDVGLFVEHVRDNIYQARYGAKLWRCAVGPKGIRNKSGEGDRVSPAGRWPLRQLFYRADRIGKPDCYLKASVITKDMGWCDEPADAAYNRQVHLPFDASHEKMWMDSDVYDCVVVLGHNDDPVVAGAGSAIFLHIAHPAYAPTAGCAAMLKEDLLEFLALATFDTHVHFVSQD